MANRVLAVMRAMFNWAEENETHGVTANPCRKIKATRETPRDRVLNDTELKHLLAHLAENALTTKEQDVLLLILATGVRASEACGLHTQELFGSEWRIPGSRTKNGLSHTVYLSHLAQEIIDRQNVKSGFVFPNPRTNSGHLIIDTLEGHLRQSWRPMGISPFHLHDLRRTMATWLGREKEDFRVIERMLNHRKKMLHFTYNQARYDDDARDAWRRWGIYLEQL